MAAPENALFDAVDMGLILLDRDQRVIAWNAWLAAASGIAAPEALGKPLSDLFPGSGIARLNSAVRDSLESGASGILTHSLHPRLLPLKTRAGREVIHNIAVRPIWRNDEADCLVQITDVTDMAHRERVLRQRQNARYDAVVDNASDPILTLDAAGSIQLANPAAAQQFGYSRQDLVGLPASMLFEDHEAWQRVWRSVQAGEAPTGSTEIVARRKDGSPSYLEFSASRWSSDSRIFVTVILRDVNQRRAAEEALKSLNQTLEQRVEERTAELMHAEEQLRQAQKMEAVGQLTGGIAHDFNNLLGGIVGALDLMQTRLAQGRVGELDRYISSAMTSAQRAAALTHRLLAFSRRQPLDPKPVDGNQLVAGMEDLLRRTIGPSITLEIVLSGALWPTLCDRVQLESALLNLCINARDAMPNGGTLTIETGNAQLDSASLVAESGTRPGEYVMIRVKDTGVGMPPDVIAQAFDPFFTTKLTGQGTGLGLSMVYGFARQSEGHTQIASTPGEGTSVCMYLPRYRGPVERKVEEVVPAGTHASQAGETVLVVEDEPVVRIFVLEVLQDLGYRTLQAVDGSAGLEVLQSDRKIDLLVTDIGLPGTNGRQLAEFARQTRPELKVLFITGYAANSTSASGFLGPGMALITKPFASNAFAEKVRHILAS